MQTWSVSRTSVLVIFWWNLSGSQSEVWSKGAVRKDQWEGTLGTSGKDALNVPSRGCRPEDQEQHSMGPFAKIHCYFDPECLRRLIMPGWRVGLHRISIWNNSHKSSEVWEQFSPLMIRNVHEIHGGLFLTQVFPWTIFLINPESAHSFVVRAAKDSVEYLVTDFASADTFSRPHSHGVSTVAIASKYPDKYDTAVKPSSS
jgi:hypothetical protein